MLTGSARHLGGSAPALPEACQIPAPDGEHVPCLVYRSEEPEDPGLAESVVLVIHGGPESQAKRNLNPLVQALAAAGHTVLVPNIRGSVGQQAVRSRAGGSRSSEPDVRNRNSP